jgi:phosphatidylglycerophosphate synthase
MTVFPGVQGVILRPMTTGELVYKVEDRSILLPYYRRYLVDPLLPLLPARLNPNTITHAGHLLNLVGTVILIAAWPKNGWPFVVATVMLQLYTWCDNADGAHARRTNQCSALGEFLDHGLDALNTVYISYLTAMALGVPPLWWVVIALIIPGAGAVTYWEQTQTGFFRLGLLNQLESVAVLSIVLLGSALLGKSIWGETSIFGITLQRAFLLWLSATILFGMMRAMHRVATRDGLGAVLPVLALILFGSAIAGAAAVDAISTITAVTLASSVNVYYATRMLSFRLHKRLPRVEPVIVAFTAVLAGLIAYDRLGYPHNPVVGPVLALLACGIFGAQAIQDARASIQQLERLPAR